MRYMMLIYSQEMETATREDRSVVAAAHRAVLDETQLRGILRAADPLEPSAMATTVRVEEGGVVVTDGPFAETKEQLAGYYILDCEDLDEALAWAAKIPTGCAGAAGCVEVRPIRQMPAGVPVNG
jgi:hypothetical protein